MLVTYVVLSVDFVIMYVYNTGEKREKLPDGTSEIEGGQTSVALFEVLYSVNLGY